VTTCEWPAEQLSAYVDGLLDRDVTSSVETHLASCASCRGLVADLSRLKLAASTLGPVLPPSAVRDSLERHLAGTGAPATPLEPTARRNARSWRAAALAATLLLLAGAAYVARGVTNPADANGSPAAAMGLASIAEELELAARQYEQAIAELQEVSVRADSELDPVVADALRNGLIALDKAISESRTALVAEPLNEAARLSLFEALRQKLEVLQAAAALTGAERPASGASRLMHVSWSQS
jgi:anti-sigma factor RsiW